MIEVYVLGILSSLGYVVNRMTGSTPQSRPPAADKPSRRDSPSMTNIYASDNVEATRRVERAAAQKMYAASLDPSRSRVVGRNYAVDAGSVTSLTGRRIAKEDFTHANMVPFFGGRVKQNMNTEANNALLESFTGSTSVMQKNKVEALSFGDTRNDVNNVTGAPDNGEFYRDRYQVPKARNNEFPIAPIHVGPGLNQGYTSGPTGGFQQFDAREFEYDPTISDLRAQLNPNASTAFGMTDNQQVTYTGRVVDGQREKLPANTTDIGRVQKNRAETCHVQTPGQLLRSTVQGGLKPMQPQDHLLKDTARQTTSVEYQGPAHFAGAKRLAVTPAARPTTRAQLKTSGPANASLSGYGIGAADDYGKANIKIYTNSRQVSTAKVYQGSLVSMVKAMTAPLVDALKGSRKEITTDTFRRFGNAAPANARRSTLAVPDAMRTTVKETSIHDAHGSTGNVGTGVKKVRVYDPSDVPRTTIKEGTLFDEYGMGSIADGAPRGQVYDESDVPRTTVKETTSFDELAFGHIDTGSRKSTVRDPADTLKTTVNETTLADGYGMGSLDPGARKGTVYDPEDAPPTTVNETTLTDVYGMGAVGTGHTRPTVHDPTDVPRTTTKETTLHDEFGMGSIDAGLRKTTVHDSDDVFRVTVKEATMFDEFGMGSVAGAMKRHRVRDPNDVSRTTVNETTLTDASGMGSMARAALKSTVVDVNHVARTTVKETLLHDGDGRGTVTGARQMYVYDPEEVARDTIRQTLERQACELNFQSGLKRGKVVDATDRARATIKETTLTSHYGNVDGARGGDGAYTTTSYVAKPTQKEKLSDTDRIGTVGRDRGGGYETNVAVAKPVKRQFLSDNDYFGDAVSSTKQPASIVEYRNARQSARQETILEGRDPTHSGPKASSSKDAYGDVSLSRMRLQERRQDNHDRGNVASRPMCNETSTKMRNTYDQYDAARLDPHVLDSLKTNPFAIDLARPAPSPDAPRVAAVHTLDEDR